MKYFFFSYSVTPWDMVHILDGNSVYVVHVWSELEILMCLNCLHCVKSKINLHCAQRILSDHLILVPFILQRRVSSLMERIPAR